MRLSMSPLGRNTVLGKTLKQSYAPGGQSARTWRERGKLCSNGRLSTCCRSRAIAAAPCAKVTPGVQHHDATRIDSQGPLGRCRGACVLCRSEYISSSSASQSAAQQPLQRRGRSAILATPASNQDSARMAELLMGEGEMMREAIYPFLPPEMRTPEASATILQDPGFRRILEGVLQKEESNPLMQKLSQQMNFEKELDSLSDQGMNLQDVARQINDDPLLAEALSNPAVQQAIMEVSENEKAFEKYIDIPEVMAAFRMMAEVHAGTPATTGTDDNDAEHKATEMEDFISASAELSASSPAVSEPNREPSGGQSRVRGMFELVNHHTQLQQALFSFLPEQMRSTQALAWLLSQSEHHQDAVSLMEAMMKPGLEPPEVDMKVVEMWIKVSRDPELSAALEDSEEIQNALLDVLQNNNPEAYADSPEIIQMIQKILK